MLALFACSCVYGMVFERDRLIIYIIYQISHDLTNFTYAAGPAFDQKRYSPKRSLFYFPYLRLHTHKEAKYS